VRHRTATLYFGLEPPTDPLNPGQLGEHFDRLERGGSRQYLVVRTDSRTYRNDSGWSTSDRAVDPDVGPGGPRVVYSLEPRAGAPIPTRRHRSASSTGGDSTTAARSRVRARTRPVAARTTALGTAGHLAAGGPEDADEVGTDERVAALPAGRSHHRELAGTVPRHAGYNVASDTGSSHSTVSPCVDGWRTSTGETLYTP
jgi:hypothetical protein